VSASNACTVVPTSSAISATTKAVVASCVVLVETAAVGPAGTPVKVGSASGAFAAVSAAISAFTNAVVAI
jgi:hypothetical protein